MSDRLTVLFRGMARQQAEDDIKDGLRALIIDLAYSPSDIGDLIENEIGVIAEEAGIEHPWVEAKIEFVGEEDEKHANEERGRPPRLFPYEKES